MIPVEVAGHSCGIRLSPAVVVQERVGDVVEPEREGEHQNEKEAVMCSEHLLHGLPHDNDLPHSVSLYPRATAVPLQTMAGATRQPGPCGESPILLLLAGLPALNDSALRV